MEDTEAFGLADALVKLFLGSVDLKDHFALVDANQKPIAWLKKNARPLWERKVRPVIVASGERHGFVARPKPLAKAADATPAGKDADASPPNLFSPEHAL